MKRIIAIALLAISTAAGAGSFAYQAAFNEHGFSTMQTATMTAGDAAVIWFVTPADGHYLVQVGSGSDSHQIPHMATLVDASTGATVAVAQGYYPSFYIRVGENLKSDAPYLIYLNNANADHSQSCRAGWICNMSVLIQPVAW